MEYKTIEYDFNKLAEGISGLTTSCEHARKKALCCIKEELNRFFEDFKCVDVIFTNNTDNEFFGIQISPMFLDCYEGVNKIFKDNCEDIKFHHYSLEFDSKLFDGTFTARQIIALLIHDINKLNSSNIIKEIVCAMDHIAMCHGKIIQCDSIMKNMSFFLFVLHDTARKMTSAFEYIPSSLSLADDFIKSYGLADDYEDAMFGVKDCRNGLKDQICCTTLTLNWYMEKYDDLCYYNHKDMANDFRDIIKFTGSELVKRNIKGALELLCDRGIYSARPVYESATKKKTSLITQIKTSGLRSLEDDVYEYRMRIKNIETENEAIYVIRQINNRMGIISDYLETEELSDMEKERFFKLYDKYDSLREELSKKAVYNRKMYGLFVDYNALQQMSNNSMTMNTYY